MLRYRALPIFLLSLLLFSLPLKADVSTVTNLDDSVTSAQAQVQVQEVETPVTCEEGAVLQLNYGNHTSGCNIDTVTDLDTFRFTGSAGDVIRTIVRSPSTMDPILEVRDPEGALIVDERCGGSCAIVIDSTLTLSGTYSISLSEWGADDTGDYELSVACLFGDCFNVAPPPSFTVTETAAPGIGST